MWVSHISSGSALLWLGILRLIQIHATGVFQKADYGQLSFFIIPINRRSYEIIILCSSFIPSIDVLSIVSWSRWLVPFWLLKWSYIMLTILIMFLRLISQNDRLIFAEILFFLVFGRKRPFCIFCRKIFHFVFLKTVWNGNYCDACLFIQILWLEKF